MFKSFRQVFSNMRYVAIAVAGGFGFVAVSAILPNLRLMKWVIGAEAMAADEKLYFFANVIVGGFKIDMVSFAAFLTFTIAVLFGVNIALAVYYFNQKKLLVCHSRGGGNPENLYKNLDPHFRGNDSQSGLGGVSGFLGAFAGFLGVGCSACGSIALSSFSSFIGIGGAIAYLPFNGREFAILSIFLLSLSVYQISRNIPTSQTCR